MARVKLKLAGLEVEFADRDRALAQAAEWAERGTWQPIVVFGPEGCGKTSWLKQTAEILKSLGFEVLYVDPLRKDYVAYTDAKGVLEKLAEAAAEVTGIAQLKLATLAVDLAKELIGRWGKKRVAVLVDDAFQAIGLDKAETYVKSLLGLIEHPPASYERIVAIAATSEGVSRERIGRHRWAELRAMWNMNREGFEELYEQLREKIPVAPSPDDAWSLTGGNPWMLAQLYQAGWDADSATIAFAESKKLTPSFIEKWRRWLEEAVEDPDALWSADAPDELVNELVERNLIVYNLHSRLEHRWIDQPPPRKDQETGIGEHVAWQTPIHREAVRRALEEA
jgi:energy-coupling factor transporter ATP-binding protein EcfA2